MKLMKSIYGMRQASRIWNQTFHNAVSQWGFERLDCEWCIYRRTTTTGTTIFAVHIDDIVATSSAPQELEMFRNQLKAQWEITKLGELKLALSIAMSHNCTDHIDNLVEEYRQVDAQTVNTPMIAGLQLRRPDKSTPVPADIAK